ncbi:MAG TPA: hypothetical protein VNJ07_01310 [Chitinophagales bacterium]|nr:hypothetical protein [Chitinophagales bacterium]
MLGSAMPEYPMLGRLKKNTAYTGVAYGDLAAMSGELNFKEDRMVSYITDSRGFRNKPGQEKKQNKIIVLGDSFGSGGEIEQDSTFVSFLSREHEDAVYNLSYPGNPLDELANLVIEIDEINLVKNPVVLWCIFTGNDVPLYLPRNGDAILDFIAENRLKEEMKSSWISATKVKIRTFFNRSPLRQMVVRIRAPKNTNVQLRDLSDSRKVYFLKHYAEMASLSKEEIQNDVKFNTFKRVFEVAKKFAQEKGITLKVILIPTKSEVYDWLYNGMPPWTTNPHPSGFGMALEELLRKLQIDYYDSKPYLIEQAKKKFYEKNEILWWSDDTHFNANGQRAFSDFIETHVLSEN